VRVLETLLRLAHPIIPYITEEIWQRIATLAGRGGNTIMRQPYPQADETRIDNSAESDMQWMMDFIVGVRKIRSGMNIAPGKPLTVLLSNTSAQDLARLDANEAFLRSLAKLESITRLGEGDEAPESATALVGEMKLLVPMAGLIDKDAELARLNKEIERLEKEVQRLNGKLNNDNFVGKAPEAVVQKEREKLAEARSSLDSFIEQKARIERL
jgi:valyl-tRNA synthetase